MSVLTCSMGMWVAIKLIVMAEERAQQLRVYAALESLDSTAHVKHLPVTPVPGGSASSGLQHSQAHTLVQAQRHN